MKGLGFFVCRHCLFFKSHTIFPYRKKSQQINVLKNIGQRFRLSVFPHSALAVTWREQQVEGKVKSSGLFSRVWKTLTLFTSLPAPAACSLASRLQQSSCPVIGFGPMCDSRFSTGSLLPLSNLVLNRLGGIISRRMGYWIQRYPSITALSSPKPGPVRAPSLGTPCRPGGSACQSP